MSKENIRKYPSIKGNLPGLQKRQSRENIDQQQCSETKLCPINDQTDVAKKIQNKLRMRKRSSNTHCNERTGNGTPPDQQDLSSTTNLGNPKNGNTTIRGELQTYDSNVDITQTINQMFQRDENIIDKISLSKMSVHKQTLKQQIMKDNTFLVCQLMKGRKLEQIVLQKLITLIQNYKVKQRIQEKEKNILSMMDDRIKKLMQMQKPLVH